VTDNTFAGLGLSEPLQRALRAENYNTPTPIQARAIPLLLTGRDLLGIAQTGTGKTAAFALPILQRLAANPQRPIPKGVRAVVLTPTRELAIQVGDGFKTYGRYMGLRHAIVMGGVGLRPQIDAISRGLDIVVATPGRLLDLIQQRHVRLDGVSVLVLDEADRMLDMGFIRDVRKIVEALPKKRQTMLFSATMPNDVAHLAAQVLNQPERVEVAPAGVTIDRIDQKVFMVEQQRKKSLLGDLLRDPELSRVIVFTRTKRGANRVAEQLSDTGISADAIHGNKSQGARQRALEGFRSGHVRVLVATDIAARGIDVDGVSHVINYELPNEPESYVHRIGRTARAGATGVAFSFCDPSEQAFLRDIEKLTRKSLTVIAGRPGTSSGGQAGDAAAQPRGEHQPRRNGSGNGNGNRRRRRHRGGGGQRRQQAAA
jgi:ATP-dependent RNA helicase RhlE